MLLVTASVRAATVGSDVLPNRCSGARFREHMKPSGAIGIVGKGVNGASSCNGHAPLKGARVLVVSHGFQPNYERGFTNGIARNGAETWLISSDRTAAGDLDRSVKVLNLRRSQESSRSRLSKVLNLVRYHTSLLLLTLCRPRWQVHVIGMLEPVWWCGIVQGLWFRVLCRRYVLTVHNLLPHDRREQVNKRLYGLAYRLPHALIVHTFAMKQQLIRMCKLPADRIHLMEHGLDLLTDMSTEELGKPNRPGPLNLLFFGSLMRYKGLDVLLEALVLDVPEFRLHIAGPCVDTVLSSEVDIAIASHPRREWISWSRGFVPESLVSTLFATADALVMPYRRIDQSGVLFQALRHGLPVIATDVGSLRNYIDETVGLICEAESPAALAQALGDFDAHRADYSRAAIRDRARRFDWSRVTECLVRVYATT